MEGACLVKCRGYVWCSEGVCSVKRRGTFVEVVGYENSRYILVKFENLGV